ncbi:MAG: hypothetical protein ACLR93_10085 [Alistipes onderdonkii]
MERPIVESNISIRPRARRHCCLAGFLEAFGNVAPTTWGKGIAVLHLADHGFGIMLRPGAVDEFTGEVYDCALC